jgi:glucosamine--fructose-6-phosphate aminotransferase (isomerizing)
MAFYLAQQRGTITQSKLVEYLTELMKLYRHWLKNLAINDKVKEIAAKFKDSNNCIVSWAGAARSR